MNLDSWEFKLYGIVQGVGFRPFVHRLTQQYDLAGWVLNSTSGVTVLVEGLAKNLKGFKEDLLANPPPLASIEKYEIVGKQFTGYKSFSIRSSQSDVEGCALMPPDTSICDKCLKEYYDAENRRHQYVMINCSECGPRFSITHTLPYDRENTSMNQFTLCPECQSEYNDVTSRRYHTEAIACHTCGPQVWLVDREGNKVYGSGNELLKQGRIIAVKGIGGFHLACNALNEEAIGRLRSRKKRDCKPFALMCRDLDVVKEYCRVDDSESAVLNSSVKPIVLLRKKAAENLPNIVNQGLHTLGVMIPYSAIHHSLFDNELKAIVLTSANLSDEPIVDNNEEALEKLKDIADIFLLHDRPIVNSCDDSVLAVVNSEPVTHRRSRGIVPLPIHLTKDCSSVFASGGDLKSTFCILKNHHAFLSQHFGDLSCYGNYQKYIKTISYYKQMTGTNPKIIACDLHPSYISAQYARSLEDVVIVGVQHHHAHLASCMAENNLIEPVLGVICDGAGYGTDGSIWGFEFLHGGYGGFERLAHLGYLPLPGVDDAVFDPSRTAFAYLYNVFGSHGLQVAKNLLPHMTHLDISTLQMQLDRNLGTWQTSSCGRLFDAVSAMLGLCAKVSYEGQAAMLLESISYREANQPYRFELVGQGYPYHLDVKNLLEDILSDMQEGVAKEVIGGRFHATVIEMVVSTISRLSCEQECRQVALSGGVFQNRLLLEGVMDKLKNIGLQVYIQRKVPTNDGGLSLGQAVVAEEVLNRVPGSNWKDFANRSAQRLI